MRPVVSSRAAKVLSQGREQTEGLLTMEERAKDAKLSGEITMLKVKQSGRNPNRKKQGMWSPMLMVKGTTPEGWVHASRA